jgi:hypothetical protein
LPGEPGGARRGPPLRGTGQKKRPDIEMPGRLDCKPDDVLLSQEIHPTIIGAESFHGPVRDGKGWFQLAMVVRRLV